MVRYMYFQVLNMVVPHKNMHDRLETEGKGQLGHRGCIITQTSEIASISRLNRNREGRQKIVSKDMFTF